MYMKDDKYYFHQTPTELCKKLIDLTPLEQGDRVIEPFRGEGAFYNHFPEFVEKYWCELEDGVDYKDFIGEYDWVISNPPFKLIESNGKEKNAFFQLLLYFTSKAKKGIAFFGNDSCLSSLTPNRIRELNESGWFVHNIICTAIKKWRGRYYYIILKKEPCSFFQFIEGNY